MFTQSYNIWKTKLTKQSTNITHFIHSRHLLGRWLTSWRISFWYRGYGKNLLYILPPSPRTDTKQNINSLFSAPETNMCKHTSLDRKGTVTCNYLQLTYNNLTMTHVTYIIIELPSVFSYFSKESRTNRKCKTLWIHRTCLVCLG